jgi:hypothetical protein
MRLLTLGSLFYYYNLCLLRDYLLGRAGSLSSAPNPDEANAMRGWSQKSGTRAEHGDILGKRFVIVVLICRRFKTLTCLPALATTAEGRSRTASLQPCMARRPGGTSDNDSKLIDSPPFGETQLPLSRSAASGALNPILDCARQDILGSWNIRGNSPTHLAQGHQCRVWHHLPDAARW